MAKIIVKCGCEDNPDFWGFIFDNLKDASYFSAMTCFGKSRTLSTDEDVTHLVDCRGCGNPGLGCSTCSRPEEKMEEAERLNEYLQEDI